MSRQLVADTHSIIWFLTDLSQLSTPALTLMEEADCDTGTLFISAITLVEVRYLVEKGKLVPDVLHFILNALDDPLSSLTLAPLDRGVADALLHIPRSIVPDMPDRIIAATAFHLGVPLVTRDHKIQALTTIPTIW